MKILGTSSPVVIVIAEQFETMVAFYEGLLEEKTRARFKNPTGNLDLVLVSSMLIIGAPAMP